MDVCQSLAPTPDTQSNNVLPELYYFLLKSYVTKCKFRIKYEDANSDLKDVQAGVTMTVLYLIYTNVTSKTLISIIAMFADDNALLACN